MIITIFRKLLKMDENDRAIEKLQNMAQSQFEETTVVLKKSGKLQEKMVKKTTTFYIGKAMGVIK